MSESDVELLRSLRTRCQALNKRIVADYSGFFDSDLKRFFRLPSERPTSADSVSVTTTATALMALSQADRLGEILKPSGEKSSNPALDQLQAVLNFKWSSS